MDSFIENLKQREIPSLYGLRGLAALTVVFFHFSAGTRWQRIFPGEYSVSLFFIISGLLITWLLLKERDRNGSVNLRQFYARRSLRLFPAFYVAWMVCAVFYHPFPGKWFTFFYLGDYYLGITHTYNILLVTWSLGVEEKFYLLWPSILRHVPEGKLLAGCAVTLVTVQAYQTALFATGYSMYAMYAFEPNLDCILMGCIIALLAHSGVRMPGWMTHWSVPILSLASIYVLPRIGAHYALAVFLVWAVSKPPRVLNNPVSKWFGYISYSLYLVHLPARALLWSHIAGLAPHRWAGQFAGQVLLAVTCAALLYYAIEKPFLRLKNLRSVRKREMVVNGAVTELQ